MGSIAFADKFAQTTTGDVASDEAARGEGKRGATVADETTGRPRGDVASVDEAARTTVWCTVTDKAMARRWSGGRRFRCGYRTAAVVIASAENPVQTAAGGVVTDKAMRGRGSGSCGVRHFRRQGLGRRREGSGACRREPRDGCGRDAGE